MTREDQTDPHAARRHHLCPPVEPPQVEHNRESTERQYALVERAIDLGWRRDQVTSSTRTSGSPAPASPSAPASRSLTAEVALAQGRPRPRPRGLPPGPQQRRLVSPPRFVRHHRHLDRRRRRHLPSRPVQRPPGPRPQGHHDRGRTAHPARAAQRRHSQQGRARRAAPRPAGRACLGREGRRGPVSIPTRPSPARSAPSSRASPNWARRARSGSGSAPKACPSPCSPPACPRSAGSRRPTRPSTRS